MVKNKIVIPRVFSTEGIHPYDQVEWSKRDVVQVNRKTGEKIFEQLQVEFPKHWSNAAVEIVTSRYFRGNMNTPQRETSLKQMIDRVVDTYSDSAVRFGYLDEKNAAVFNDELKYLLVNQAFSWNSPVWFSVGTKDPQQISACFILGVDDSIDSILNWYREEGLIFKGGSGAGVNLSKLRSSYETLSSGGVSSGPVTFMRAADASAGTIKSGGKNRRAAKMIVLDVDHPDIEEFIWCKAKEEKKIKVLRDAGFDMDLGGEDLYSVQYQNGNNSVALSNDFMKSYETGSQFNLISRSTGKVVKTVDAKDLMHQVADAAWQCADPGVMFLDTMNEWNTVPKEGKIESTNPCFTGDTLVATADGRNAVPIKQLADEGKDVDVYAFDKNGKPVVRVMKNVRRTRNNTDVYRVTLDDGSTFKATGDHRIMVRDGSYREILELQPGDQLMPFDSAVRDAGWGKRRKVRGGTDDWRLQYQLIAEKKFGQYPIKGSHVHHKDKNPLNDDPSNMELMTPHNHMSYHASGSNNSVHRIKDKAQWRKHLSESLSGESNPRWINGYSEHVTRTCPICGKVFTSQKMRNTCSVECGRTYAQMHPHTYTCKNCGENFEGVKSRDFCSYECSREAFARDHMSEHVCEECGITFMSIYDSVRFCSKQCGSTHYHKMNGAPKYTMRTCPNCGSDFVPRRKESVYCNSSCAAQYRVKEQKAFPYTHNHRVVAVDYVGKEDVYDGEVPGLHNFAIITSVKNGDTTTGELSGVGTSNCGEFVHLNNTSCNLASLNLMFFNDEKGQFDVQKFIAAIDLVILSMDISVEFGDFPTEEITRQSKRLRPLGIGVANLGALLMCNGLPYDSEGGRSLASSITSLMTASAYRRSSEIAGVKGPYEAYENNSKSHMRILKKHQDANSRIVDLAVMDTEIHDIATEQWKLAIDSARENGIRNDQVSLAAPTGTISFLMDCSTTGIEPDFSLVKYKKTSDGASMSYVNYSVPFALQNLGYSPKEIEDINGYIEEHNSVVGAPHLQEKHLAIFDCAVGERPISANGHLQMMAALQPFLSGAISKTCNLPGDATIEDIENVFYKAWKLGLKDITIYRDGCKANQPLNTTEQKNENSSDEQKVDGPVRRKLPEERPARNRSFSIGGADGYITEGLYDDGTIGELFLKMGKQGSTLSGMMDAFAISVSIGLQYGVPLETFVRKFVGQQFTPSGLTSDKDIRMAQSILDYVFKRLALNNLPLEKRVELNTLSSSERRRYLNTGSYEDNETDDDPDSPYEDKIVLDDKKTNPSNEDSREEGQPFVNADAPVCPKCGSPTTRSGSCFVCSSCGETTGCS